MMILNNLLILYRILQVQYIHKLYKYIEVDKYNLFLLYCLESFLKFHFNFIIIHFKISLLFHQAY